MIDSTAGPCPGCVYDHPPGAPCPLPVKMWWVTVDDRWSTTVMARDWRGAYEAAGRAWAEAARGPAHVVVKIA